MDVLNNFRKKDTLEIFNERWKANNSFRKNILSIRRKNINNMTPSEQAKRVSSQINLVNNSRMDDLVNKLKKK